MSSSFIYPASTVASPPPLDATHSRAQLRPPFDTRGAGRRRENLPRRIHTLREMWVHGRIAEIRATCHRRFRPAGGEVAGHETRGQSKRWGHPALIVRLERFSGPASRPRPGTTHTLRHRESPGGSMEDPGRRTVLALPRHQLDRQKTRSVSPTGTARWKTA